MNKKMYIPRWKEILSSSVYKYEFLLYGKLSESHDWWTF
jgi:hypothetical protein